jgi:hypothetical protein
MLALSGSCSRGKGHQGLAAPGEAALPFPDTPLSKFCCHKRKSETLACGAGRRLTSRRGYCQCRLSCRLSHRVAHDRSCRANNPPCHAFADFDQALKLEPSFSAEEFQGVLIASRLAERRPSDDMNCLLRCCGADHRGATSKAGRHTALY